MRDCLIIKQALDLVSSAFQSLPVVTFLSPANIFLLSAFCPDLSFYHLKIPLLVVCLPSWLFLTHNKCCELYMFIFFKSFTTNMLPPWKFGNWISMLSHTCLSLRIQIILIFIFVYICTYVCVPMCVHTCLPTEARRGRWSLWRWSFR